MRPIILATDGSPTATAATAVAIELAAASDSPLVVVAAWDTPYTGIGYAPVPAVLDLGGDQKERAERAAAVVARQAVEAHVEVETLIRRGFPVDEICSEARTRDARLIIVGSHGWGPVRRMLFGSVSAGVLNHAPCPVLVVPAAGDGEVEGNVRERIATEV